MKNQVKKAAVYQIYVPSFCDSNNDGIGDLPGITGKLDYIAGLGVSHIWLTPIYVSPGRDNGYDVADYYAVNPRFGTMADFEILIKEAERRNLKIMLDMVLNHTSTEHEWFQKALNGDEKYQNYYIFKDSPADGRLPTNWLSKFGGPAWQYAAGPDKYYLHLFDKTQADLNWDNPEVRGELYKIVNFWLEKGVKGLRFDVINLISKPAVFHDDEEGDGRRFYTDGINIHRYLKELHEATFGRYDDVLTVGEMSSTSIENCIRYSAPQEKELAMVFNFHHLKLDYADGDKWTLSPFDFMLMKRLFNDWQTGMQQGGGVNALFWSNHDQPRIVSRMGNDAEYHYESASMLAAALYLMDGVPYIFQGEEIGMTNAGFQSIEQYRDIESLNYYKELSERLGKERALAVLAAKSRDNGRTPVSWNAGTGHGFSKAKPWLEFSVNAENINVEKDLAAEKSLYKVFRQILSLRQSYAVFTEGEYSQEEYDNIRVYAYRRVTPGAAAYVVANFYEKPTQINVTFVDYNVLFNNYSDIHTTDEGTVLKPYQAIVFYRET